MIDQELENKIRKTLSLSDKLDRQAFEHTLSILEGSLTTKSPGMRYIEVTTKSNVIYNKIAYITSSWKSRRIILLPSFLILFIIFIGTLGAPLSSKLHGKQTLEQIASESEEIEGTGMDTDDQVIITSFDEPSIDELSTIQNEI